MNKMLDLFHPLLARWFLEKVGTPTEAQMLAWPRIAAGEHVLVTAPTGSGKTLTAFLWAINQLVTGSWECGATRVLYVSPLKALNNDIQRNLLAPLAETRDLFEREGVFFPDIQALTRSGDTPQSDRRRMVRRPPEILITTPESLNLLLSSASGRSILSHLKTVILDEIHAVAGNKRGTHLITAVERLVPLSGEFQRVALSATVRPLELVARFVGGLEKIGRGLGARHEARPVTVLRSSGGKRYDLRIRHPESAVNRGPDEIIWDALAEEFVRVIQRNRSTLIFVNSRRICERIALLINNLAGEAIAYSHHGSLSREIREEVERKLKAGELAAIVATSSLEMGIDIGSLDEVLMAQSPFEISSAVQRLGRAGHRVGELSKGALFPTHPHDFLEATVLVDCVLRGDIEELRVVEAPLDVLAQVLISMTAVESWDIDDLYASIKTSHPYRNLGRREFDSVLNMLAGRYAESRLRELKPRVSIDPLTNRISARGGALLDLYASGGVIPDRGYFHLRQQDGNARIGELDEEFVWEARPGQVFTLGARNWRIERITHNEVFVQPARPGSMAAPFWIAEETGRGHHYSLRIGEFLEEMNARLREPGLEEWLMRERRLDEASAKILLEYLRAQKAVTGADLPHRRHLVVEFSSAAAGSDAGHQIALHTFWGGRVNKPFAIALESAWEERFGHRAEVFPSNDCVVLLTPAEIRPEEILSLVSGANLDQLLRKGLEGGGFFGARFREAAGRALLLGRGKTGRRTPLWLNRLRSKRLMDAVMRHEDFPILLEAWRCCMRDEFEIEALRERLAELESGEIAWTMVRTGHPSPMARNMAWRQVNLYMYKRDESERGEQSRLRNDLLREVAFSPDLRPRVDRELVERFEAKRQRLHPGYAPRDPRELIDWVRERGFLTMREWDALLEAGRRDSGLDAAALIEGLEDRVVRLARMDGAPVGVAPLESARSIGKALFGDTARYENLKGDFASIEDWVQPEMAEEEDIESALTDLVGEWLSWRGPMTPDEIAAQLSIAPERLTIVLDDLIDSERVLTGGLTIQGEEERLDEICDSQNFETLLRIARAARAPVFEPLELDCLPFFLAGRQGLLDRETNVEGVARRIENLLCLPLEAGLWESEILPARVARYSPSWLDTIMLEGELVWLGFEGRRVAFCHDSERELMGEEKEAPSELSKQDGATGSTDELDNLLSDPAGRYDFGALLRKSSWTMRELSGRLWEGVWRGRLTNDTFLSMRKGVQCGFEPPESAASSGRERTGRRGSGHRALRAAWRGAMPFAGHWRRLTAPEAADGFIEMEELRKDRVRILLDRYGVLFRELLRREAPAFQWPHVFRALRIMELSGEVFSGAFFNGVPGLQFVSPEAFQALHHFNTQRSFWWIEARDPVSLCGLGLESLPPNLPRRAPGNHLSYRGAELVFVSLRKGRELRFFLPPDDPDLSLILGPLRHLLERDFEPLRQIGVETINDLPAPKSPYVAILKTCFETSVDYKNVTLYRRV